ncbi:MAG TPA: hypothetical protein VK607_24225 [Kofleriaceae bacterium]|nr:hypothetical protein [Kofleriaceae bacterium]
MVAVTAAACNGRDPRGAPRAAARASPAAAVVVDARPAIEARPVADAMSGGGLPAGGDPPPDDPAAEAMIEAFGGHTPVLPLLSPDGALAAIDVSEGIGLSSYASYEVAFLAATGRVREHIAVVDRALARAVMTDAGRAAGAPPLAIPRPRLARAAARVAQRLAGYTPFAQHFDVDAIGRADGTLALGDAALALRDDGGGLELRLVGADGAVLHRDRVAVRARQFTDRDGGRCGGRPRLSGVWWDPARRRTLLAIIFPGHDSCEDEPVLWLLW